MGTTGDMRLLAVVFMYMGIETTFWTSIYSTSLGFTTQFGVGKNTMLAYNAMLLGVGEMLGG